jgi:hypothetical protein
MPAVSSHSARLAVFAASVLGAIAAASSHREAPFITELPKVDGTDFYMFNSYEPGRSGTVILIANYVPLQDAYGGPNYFQLDPDAVYAIRIDNDGDAVEDLSFEFRFRNQPQDITVPAGGNDIAIPLLAVGPISARDTSALNLFERYTVNVRFGPPGSGEGKPISNAITGETIFTKPLDNVGNKTIPDYASYAAAHSYVIDLPGGAFGRMFVGQRKDPFVVNLGETFDLVNLNPLGPVDGAADSLADKNVTSFILEIPAEFLNAPGSTIIGGWTTAHLPRVRRLLDDPSFGRPAVESGDLVQVSRLGNPLVNEVVIGLKDKNRFNNAIPSTDGQFADYVLTPSLPVLLNALFGVAAPCTPRNDLVAVFLTGVDGLNQPAGVVPSEMLRLNTAIPAVAKGSQNNLGVVGGDVAGFPNGRRPGDDVVDIALRAVMGVLLDSACAPNGQLPYTDGAFVDDSFFTDVFPFILDPIPGSPNQP